jgi:hypothetical protein
VNAIELLRQEFDHVHEALRADLGEVEPEWLFWQPAEGLNHVGFLFWHIVRDEDVVVSHVTRQPQLWQAGGWHSRFGMSADEQGTGLSPAALAQFRYNLHEFMSYAEAVWAEAGPRLARLSEPALEAPAWPGSGWNVGRQLVEGCLGHAWLHLGEIRSLMGLRGWRFRE